MKKITLILLTLLSFISYDGLTQSYKYHRLDAYLNIQDACVGNTQKAFRVKVNIKINSPLQKNKFHLIDLGDDFNLGMRYCKVLNASNSSGDSDMDLANPNIGAPINVCDFNILRYHRFETFTTLEKAKNNLCGDTTSHDGRYKANIIINRLLSVNKIYPINLGNGLGVRYCKILNRYNGSGDADIEFDGRDIGNSITINCVIDTDNDGIPDSQDNCPTVAGPPSNNGCPITDPKFYLEKATIKQNGKTWDFLQNDIPTIETSLYPTDYSKTEFNLTIFNGGGTASQANWSFFISDKNKLGSGSIKIYKFFHRHTLTITAGGKKSIHLQEKISGRLREGNISFNLLPNKTYYFHVFFDGYKMPSSYGSGQFHHVFPFKVKRVDFSSKSLSASFLKSTSFKTSILETKNDQKLEPYKISFYNLSGLKIMTKEVHNIEEENATSLVLPKGIYLLKSKKGDRKIYVN